MVLRGDLLPTDEATDSVSVATESMFKLDEDECQWVVAGVERERCEMKLVVKRGFKK